MKTLKCLLLGLILISPALMFAQKKAIGKVKHNPVLITQNDAAMYPLAKPAFWVEIAKAPCTRDGVSLEAIVNGDKRQYRYSFIWIVDGSLFGRSPRIECVSGRSATVYVTRSDGARASSTILLHKGNGNGTVLSDKNSDTK